MEKNNKEIAVKNDKFLSNFSRENVKIVLKSGKRNFSPNDFAAKIDKKYQFF